MHPILLLLGFGTIMIALSVLSHRKNTASSAEEFLVASRNISVWKGAFSIAISWAWAPAIFIAGLQAYTKGLAGAFWFIVPNVVCFFLFAVVAYRVRKIFPSGYTFPQFIKARFRDTKTHYAFLAIFFGYQLAAIIVNSVAGGTLLSLLTGMNISIAIIGLSGTALIYSVIGGLRASILTDIIQMIIVLGLAGILVPWTILQSGGWDTVFEGLDGISGSRNIFDPAIAWTFGIPMTLSLLAGPLSDQQFFQRAFAVHKEKIFPTFIYGGLLFGLIPIILAIPGFIGANPSLNLQVTDAQMITPTVLQYFLPAGTMIFFTLMTFAGLSSTMDSAYCALSSFVIADLNLSHSDKHKIHIARIAMISIAVLGTGIALLEPKLLWVFLISGALASVGLFPTIFAVFSDRYNKNTAFVSILLGFAIALPLSAYANTTGNTNLIVWASILSVAIGCLIGSLQIIYARHVKQ